MTYGELSSRLFLTNEGGDNMSRIVVCPAEKGKFAVLVNFGAQGRFVYDTPETANTQAKVIQEKHHPHASLSLWVAAKVK